MTKKDYIIIAEALRRSRPESIAMLGNGHATYQGNVRLSQREQGEQSGKAIQFAMMCTNIMEALAAENPRFSEEKFIAYINK